MMNLLDSWENPEVPEPRALASILGIHIKKPSLSTLGRIGLGVATGGASEGVRAATGNSSIFDPVLNAVGLGIPGVGPEPKADEYYGKVEGQNAENLRRAYEMADGKSVREPDSVATDPIRAVHTTGPTGTDAHDAGGVERAQAERVGPIREVVSPFLGDAHAVTAAKAGPAAHSEGATIGPASLQRSTDVATTDTDSEGMRLMRQAANGEAPSKAEALMRSGLDDVAARQMSMAGGALGNERRGAKLSAMLAIGQQGAEAANKFAALRADEMERARGGLSQFEQHAQNLKQGALSLQAQIDAAAARGDADSVNKLRAQQAEIEARASEVNAGADNTHSERDADREQRSGELTASAADARDSERAGYNYKAQDANAARALTAADSDAGRGTSVSLADAAAANARAESLARRRDESDQQYASRVQAWQEANAGREMDAQKVSAANELTGESASGQLRQGADRANAEIKANALSGARAVTGQETGIADTKYGAAQAKYQAELAKQAAAKNARMQLAIKGGTAIATGGTSLALPGGMPSIPGATTQGSVDDLPSDRRLKTDIKKPSPGETIRLADAYQKMIKTYKYKEGDGEETAGVIAQDLAKDPLGKSFVHKKAGGTLAVDYHGLHSAVIAGMAAKMDAQASRTAKARRN